MEHRQDDFYEFIVGTCELALPFGEKGAFNINLLSRLLLVWSFLKKNRHFARALPVDLSRLPKSEPIQMQLIPWSDSQFGKITVGKSTTNLKASVARLEKLSEANQAAISRLLQARQRLIQLENSRLDAIWQATQAQSDLMLAVGAPSVIGTLPAGS